LIFVLAGHHYPLNGWEAEALMRKYGGDVVSGGVSPSEVDFALLGKRVNTEISELLREANITGISQTNFFI
jgi:hypothetical protein